MEQPDIAVVRIKSPMTPDPQDGVQEAMSDILACMSQGQQAPQVASQHSTASKVNGDRGNAKEIYLVQFQSSESEQQAQMVHKLVELMVPQHPSAALAASFAGFMLTKSASFHKQLLAAPEAFVNVASLMHSSNPAAAAAVSKALYAMTVNRLEGRDVTAACCKAVHTPGLIEGLILMLDQGNRPSIAACVLQNLSAHFISGSAELANLSAQITCRPAAASSLAQLLCSKANTAADTDKMFAHQASSAAAFVLGVLCEQGRAMCKLIADTPTVVQSLLQLLQPGAGAAAAAEAAWTLGNLAVHSDLATFVSLTQGPNNIVSALVAALQLGGFVSEAAAKSLAKMASSERPEFNSSTAMAVVAAPAATQALLKLLGRSEAVTTAVVTVFAVITKGSSHEALLYIATQLGAIEGLVNSVKQGAAALAVPDARSAAAAAVCVLHQLLFLRQDVRHQLCGHILTAAGASILAHISSIAEKSLGSRPHVAQTAAEVVTELVQHASVTQRASIASIPGIAAALGTCLLASQSPQQQQTGRPVAVTVATAAAAGESLMQLATSQFVVQHGSSQQDSDLVGERLEKLKLHLAGIAPVLSYLLQLPVFQDLTALQLTALAVQQVPWHQQVQQQQQQNAAPPQAQQLQQLVTYSGGSRSISGVPSACSSGFRYATVSQSSPDQTALPKRQQPEMRPAAQAPQVILPQSSGVPRPQWTYLHAPPTEADCLLFQQYQRHKARRKAQEQELVAVGTDSDDMELRQLDPDTPTSAYSVTDVSDTSADGDDDDSTACRDSVGVLSPECAEAVWAEAAAAALRTHTTWLAGEKEGSGRHSPQVNKTAAAAAAGCSAGAAAAACGRRSVGAVATSGVTYQHQVRQQVDVQRLAMTQASGKAAAAAAAAAMAVAREEAAGETRGRDVLGPSNSNQVVPPLGAQQKNKRMRIGLQL